MKKTTLSHVLLTTLVKEWLTVLCLLLTVAGSIIFSLLPPLVLAEIIDRLTGSHEITLGLTLLYFGLLLGSGFFDALKEIFITLFGQRLTRNVRSAMCDKLSRLPAGYYTLHDSGETTSRFVGDVDTIETLFASGIISMVVDVCKVISILVVIFVKSSGLGLLMLAITPILFGFTRLAQKKMLIYQKKYRAAVGRVTGQVPETIRNIRMIHIFAKEDYFRQKYDARIEEGYAAKEKNNFFDAVYSPVIVMISTIITALLFLAAAGGGKFSSFFGMSVGTAVAIIAYVDKVFSPLEAIGMEIQSIQSALAGVSRIREFLEEDELRREDEKSDLLCPDSTANATEPRPASMSNATEPSHVSMSNVTELSHVSFAYEDGKTVLQDLSFSVEKGEYVALTGRTGAGKSTIFKLLLGFYEPLSGQVLIKGLPASSITTDKKRALFGYVEQTFRPIPGTIADQITVLDEKIAPDQIKKAAALSGIDAAISALPEGYNTVYKDSLFSQGQKQQLNIARAVVADPEILLLDEITANLDTETEQRVMDSLRAAARDRTVISISHRLYELADGSKRVREIRI